MESAVEVGDHFRVVDRRYVSRRYVSKPRCIPSFHPGNPVDFYGKAVIGLPMYLRSFLKSNLFTYRRTPRDFGRRSRNFSFTTVPTQVYCLNR